MGSRHWWPGRGSPTGLCSSRAAVTAAGALWLLTVLSRGQAWPEQDVLLRQLWAAAKRIPSGYVLCDPDTGELLGAERERAWLTLAVIDPPEPGPRLDNDPLRDRQ